MSVMRRVLLAVGLLLAGSVVLATGPAGADPDGGSGDSTFDFSESNNTSSATSADPTPSPSGAPSSSISVPPPKFDYDIVYGREEVGQEAGFDVAGCWGVVQVDQDDPRGVSYAEAVAGADEWGGNGSGQGRCVDEPTEVFDVAAYVNQVWQTSVQPPPPSPLQVAPGRAVTGLRSYLEIGGDVPYVTTIPNPVGANIRLTATPRYVVSWGDGATAETESQGVPWPGGPGEISHVFTDEGEVTVTVQAYWRGEWTAGAAGGTLPELPVPTDAALDLPVEEYQVVTD